MAASTLLELLASRAVGADRRAYTFISDGVERESLTYRQLAQRAAVIAACLVERHQPGRPVLLLHDPGPGYVAALFGCFYAGAIAVPAYPPLRGRSMARLDLIAADSGAAVVCSTQRVRRLVEAAGTGRLQRLEWVTTDALPDAPAVEMAPRAAADDLAFLQYTSGSTGTAKGVMVTHADVLANSERICRLAGHTPDDCSVTWLPPFDDMGLVGAILQPMYAGFPAYLMAPAEFVQRPLRWLELLSRYRATTTVAPNSGYELCVRRTTPEQRSGLDLRTWRVAFNGAEPIAPGTLSRFADAFGGAGFAAAAFRPCYGLAEATLLVTGHQAGVPELFHLDRDALAGHLVRETSPGHAASRTFVSCGPPGDCPIEIVDPVSLQPCGPDRVGEILVDSRHVARGYWHRPELTASTFAAVIPERDRTYLRTGDLGFINAGRLFVTGRVKDPLVVNGRNWYPEDLELTVADHVPGVDHGRCAVLALPAGDVERVGVAIEAGRRTMPGDAADLAAAVRAAISAEHGLHVHAVAVFRFGRLPTTTSGTLLRGACREAFLDPSSPDVLHRDVLEEAAVKVPTAAELGIDARQVDEAQRVSLRGTDSASVIRLRARVAEDFGLEVPLEVLDTASPLDASARFIVRHRPAPPAAHAVSVRIAANFTAEPVRASLEFWFRQLGIAAECAFAPYNQVLQQLLDPGSTLNAPAGGYRLVFVRVQDWLRDAHEAASPHVRARLLEDIVERFTGAVVAASTHGSPLIVAICPNDPGSEDEALHRRMAARLESVPGVVCLMVAQAAEPYEVDEVFNPHGQREGHIPFTSDYFVALGTIAARTIAALRRSPVKVVVADCDNTLWAGHCGEDGPDGVVVTAAHAVVQARLRALKDDGFLLCLCSKNDHATVADTFREAAGMVLRLEDLAATRINWLPKSCNVIELARELDLALDSFVFLDDSPNERAEVRAQCPDVLVLEPPADPRDWPVFLHHVWVFDRVTRTAADAGRTEQYRRDAIRNRSRAQFASVEEFLDHLELVIEPRALTASDVPRVTQLIARTSQFTTGAADCTDAEVVRWVDDPARMVETVRARDRYGDYGLVGVLGMRCDQATGVAEIDRFVLSCRALGKRVEQAMYERALTLARDRGCARLRVAARWTRRNGPFRDFFGAMVRARTPGDGTLAYELPVTGEAIRPRIAPSVGGDAAAEERPEESARPHVAPRREPADLVNRIAGSLQRAGAIADAMRTARSALPDPAAFASGLERAVAWLWEETLGVRGIGPADRFFDLGGDSLRLAEFVARVHELYRVGVSLGALQNPSVAQVAQHIETIRGHGAARTRAEPQLAADIRLDPRIALDGLPAARIPAQRILLTGANGFLGSFLVHEFLQRTPVELTCLVRAATQRGAERRLAESLRRYGLGEPDVRRVRVIAGDLECPLFGLPTGDYAGLVAEVDSVMHCAARVNFVCDYQSLKRPNVDSAVAVLDFATSARVKPVHFISTIGMLMSSARPRGVRVLEDAPPSFERGLPNGYEQSKWVIDSIMGMAIARGLPVAVYRPGMLIGETRTGALPKTNEFAACMIKGCIQMACAPAVDTAVELVPIDFVARLIVEIAMRGSSIGHAFHLGHPRPIRLLELLDVLRSLGYPVAPVPFAEWKRRLFDLGPALRGNALYPFADFIQQLDEPHMMMPDVDDANTRKVAEEAGVVAEPMDAVVRRVIAHFEASGFLSPAQACQ